MSEKQSEPNCYGDGNVYRGVRSKDSEIKTITYTTPQTKPLSDEEIMEIASPMFVDVRYPSTAIELARAIEAKVRGQ